MLELKNRETEKYPLDQKRTMLQANILAAMLVGFWARAGDGHPGAQILAEGLQVLEAVVWYKRQSQKKAADRPHRRRAPN